MQHLFLSHIYLFYDVLRLYRAIIRCIAIYQNCVTVYVIFFLHVNTMLHFKYYFMYISLKISIKFFKSMFTKMLDPIQLRTLLTVPMCEFYLQCVENITVFTKACKYIHLELIISWIFPLSDIPKTRTVTRPVNGNSSV
jgi:hypothetical protein